MKNKIVLIGRIISDIVVNKEKQRIEFVIDVRRRSEVTDKIKCYMYIDKLATLSNILVSKHLLRFSGRLCSEDYFDESNIRHLNLFMYAFSVEDYENKEVDSTNEVTITGIIRRKSNPRYTPKKIKICDILISCNSAKDRTEYIPVIFWNSMVDKIQLCEVGDAITVSGRFQSRCYTKKTFDIKDNLMKVDVQNKVAYELSCIDFE